MNYKNYFFIFLSLSVCIQCGQINHLRLLKKTALLIRVEEDKRHDILTQEANSYPPIKRTFLDAHFAIINKNNSEALNDLRLMFKIIEGRNKIFEETIINLTVQYAISPRIQHKDEAKKLILQEIPNNDPNNNLGNRTRRYCPIPAKPKIPKPYKAITKKCVSEILTPHNA